jgi:ABC-type transport system substrate-binding protein
VVDRHTVKFTLSEPFAWSSWMSRRHLTWIIAREAVEKFGISKAEAAIGTGLFMLERTSPTCA